jgi:type II secretory pathway pseudopilin PulG
MLVALTISGILVTVIFRVITGNSEFVGMQAARQEVQQTARATLDLVAADLRSAPPGGILEMEPGSVRLYTARGAGMLCAAATPSSGTVWALFPADAFPSDSVFARRSWGLALEQTADPATSTGDWRFVSQVGHAVSGDPCATVQPTLTSRHVRLGFTAPGGSTFVGSGTLQPGTQALLYEEVRYDVAESTSGGMDGYWLRRMAGYGADGEPNMQPMAGPVPAAGALTLTYLQADGVTPATDASQVRRVRIRIIAQSQMERDWTGTRAPVEVDTLATEVYLRN